MFMFKCKSASRFHLLPRDLVREAAKKGVAPWLALRQSANMLTP
jgi:hypothetical protein